jgi:hypothetical protein
VSIECIPVIPPRFLMAPDRGNIMICTVEDLAPPPTCDESAGGPGKFPSRDHAQFVIAEKPE